MTSRSKRNKGLGSGSLGHSKHRQAAAPRGRLKSPAVMYWMRLNAEGTFSKPQERKIRDSADVRAAKWVIKRKTKRKKQ